MSLDAASIPLAGVAGVLSILSPCVWPLVPVVMSSAATGWTLLLLGLLVLTGWDKTLEALALDILSDWTIAL